MKLTNWVAALILFAISVVIPNNSWSAVKAIAQLTNPNGVVVDNIGTVYVQSLSANSDGGLYKFDSNGNLLAFNNQMRLLQNYISFIDPSWFWLAKSRFFQWNPAAIAVARQNGFLFPN